MALNLLSNTSRVETPFIMVTIGQYTFGMYNKSTKNVIDGVSASTKILTTYPNYMQSLVVNKVNGTVNTYTLTMVYAITAGDDPNLLEKVFSSISKSRRIKISYGDLSAPSFIYNEEEAIITDIKSSMNINSSTITYTISATSTALALAAGNLSFPKRVAKPSDIIKEILYDKKYGLLDIFYGMRDRAKIIQDGLIASDDRVVTIEAQKSMTVFQYLEHLVKCMSNVRDNSNSIIKNNKYALVVSDSVTNGYTGPYFKVIKVADNISNYNSLDVYEVDVGAMSKDIVLSFSVDDNETYSILYNYSNKIEQSNYIYRLDNNGNLVQEYSPKLSSSSTLMKTTESDKTWWTNVTQYPISASLTIKGLLRPAILMTYVKLNVLFYGQKHLSSGYYIITKQTDQIDASGYKTVLKLTRIKGDE